MKSALVDDESLLSKIKKDFKELSDNVNTGIIKKSNLEAVRSILAGIPKNQSFKLPSYSVETESPEQIFDIIELPTEAISKKLSGWKLDVFNCLNDLPQQQFTLTDVYSFENHLKNKHSQNNNVRDKIRQQLQVLRDFGIVEFLGYGNYKKLWK